jgi:hypothetical protein
MLNQPVPTESKISVRIPKWKWTLLGLYMALIIGLVGLDYTNTVQILDVFRGELFWSCFTIIVTFLTQVVLVFGQGTTDLCRPVRRRRIVAPVAIGAVMISVLVTGIYLALRKATDAPWPDISKSNAIIFVLAVTWLAWGVVFFYIFKGAEKYKVARNLVGFLLSGSLLNLLVTVPSHIVVSRKPGCFVGIDTLVALVAGVCVMLWSFGPAILLLFLREYRNEELRREAGVDS